MDKDVKALVRSIEYIDGVEIRVLRNQHLGVYLKGQFVTSLPTTPGDRRWRDNAVADLRRAGITPGTKPKGPAKEPAPLMSIGELREKVAALSNRNEFARFLVDDMPKLQPKLRTYKNYDSAIGSLHTFGHDIYGLSEWTHLLLDQAFRTWDRLQAQRAKTSEPKVVEPTQEQLATRGFGKLTPSEAGRLGGLALAERRRREREQRKVATVQEQLVRAAANGDHLRDDYAATLLAILKEEGSLVDDKILDRLDKLAGVES